VRLFSSLGLVVAPPVREPGQDTAANFGPRLGRLAPGQPPLLTARSPDATGLASSLSGCLLFHRSAVRFLHRSRIGRFSRILPRPRALPGANAHFCPAFRRLLFGGSRFHVEPPESFVRADAQ
jgi:hypothetical protein